MSVAEPGPGADPTMVSRPDCVLRDLLHRQAQAHPERVYAAFEGGERWTFRRLLEEVRTTAAGLATLGVRQGDSVLLWMPHGPTALRTWFAVNYLGAVAVPINLAYKGGLLERVIENSQARMMVAQSSLIERLNTVDTAGLEHLVAIGGDVSAIRLRVSPESALYACGSEPPEPPEPIRPWDLQVILYTSGTTGPSKGVLCSYVHVWKAGQNVYFLDRDDRYMVNLPLAHVSGVLPCVLMLALGGSVAIVERFQTDSFWEQINACEATFVILLGAMAKFLLSREPSPAEQNNTLNKMLLLPYDMDIAPMRKRFDVDVYTSFNMTEVCCPIMSVPNPSALGSCGRLRPGIEARIVDEYDFEVAAGGVGALVLRSDLPWAFSHGYQRDPEATAHAWRNGWFHTGDAFRRDAKGNYYFVDRLKDTIRRRGENISSFEVEAELLAHPVILEAAVVAVPSEWGEDEVMAVVTLKPAQELDPMDLIDFLRPRLAHFMIPRFIRVMDELPKTATLKVEKHLLRKDGRGAAGVWDRQTAGVEVRRDT
jgi:crotonobetaine/carnitine-CoA ligase